MSAYLSREYQKSVECLDTVLAENPSDHRSLYLLALDYAALDDSDRAIELIEKAVSLERREPQYQIALGILYHNGGKADTAQQYFLAAQKISPDDPNIEVLLGRLDLERGDEKSAGAHFERALALQPQHPEARELLKSLGIAVATESKTE
jgi:tetratricopeptide (TPR) repeat protein